MGNTRPLTTTSPPPTSIRPIRSIYSFQCFGDNSYGQLGIGSDDEEVGTLDTDMGANLAAVDLGGNAIEIAAGGSSVCAKLGNGNLKCW